MPVETHFLSTDAYRFSQADRDAIAEMVARAIPEIRSHLPGLPDHVHVLFEPGRQVIDVTGEVGYAMAPHAIRWTVDPSRNVVTVATAHLHHSLVHECHHATRLVRFPEEAYTNDWVSGAVFEGLATAFERDVGAFDAPWGAYDESTIDDWARELVAQPIDATYSHWKFEHPDGRRWIAYRVGTWIVDRACANENTTAADLVWTPANEIVRAADLAFSNG